MRVIVGVAALVLAGCSMGPEIKSSTTDAVTLTYYEGQAADGERKAAEECNRYGKRAKLRGVHDATPGAKMAIYDCVV